MLRTLAPLAALLAIVPSCTPKAGMVAGAITTAVGGAMVLDANHKADNIGEGIVQIGEFSSGATLAMTGVAILLGSTIWLAVAHDDAPPAPAAPLAPMPPMLAVAPSFAPPGSATAVLNGRVAQLSSQLQLEARAGHCAAATALARRIAALDRGQALDLVQRDRAVAACVAFDYKM